MAKGLSRASTISSSDRTAPSTIMPLQIAVGMIVLGAALPMMIRLFVNSFESALMPFVAL